MKKLQKTLPVLMVVLALALTGLSGCQIFSQQQPPQNSIDNTPLDRRIGTIQSLGAMMTNNQGTDILTMDDGSTILLRSAAINLDDPKYSGKKVEVSGVLTYTTDNKQIMEVESIDVLEAVTETQQSQQQAPTWRSYVNEGLGFQVQYRDDLKVDEGKETITFTRAVSPNAIVVSPTQEAPSTMEITTTHSITITVKPHGPKENLFKDFLKLADDKPATLLAAGYSKSRIGMDSIEAYKHISADAKSVSFSFDDGKNFDQIAYTGGNDSQSLEDQNIFYDFLATFKLFNPNPSLILTQQIISNVPATVKPAPSPVPSPPQTPATTTPPVPTPAPSTTVQPQPAPTPSASADTGATQELLPGYNSFTSSGYRFTMQYPKSWYYGQTAATDSNVVRRYDFGSKPVDQQPGSVNLDILSGSVPSGSSSTVGDKTVVMTSDGTTNSYYYKGKNGRLYRVSGPAGMDSALRNMIGTLQEQ